jgi:hypothetical protein
MNAANRAADAFPAAGFPAAGFLAAGFLAAAAPVVARAAPAFVARGSVWSADR